MKIAVNNICFRYNSKPVLESISLQLKAGQLMGVVGPNGSGKSTLIKCMDRILNPQNGSILIDGENIESFSMNDVAKKVGYVPQWEDSKFPVTVFDTVLMGRKPHLGWKPSRGDLETVSYIISLLGLEELAMREINAISGGQRQKVIIARALAQEPEVLLLDEPTSNLDLRHQLEVLTLIKEQTIKGIAAVVAIHDLNLAVRYCDKFVMLKDGMIYAAGGPEIIQPENIEPVYRIKVNTLENQGQKVIVPVCPL